MAVFFDLQNKCISCILILFDKIDLPLLPYRPVSSGFAKTISIQLHFLYCFLYSSPLMHHTTHHRPGWMHPRGELNRRSATTFTIANCANLYIVFVFVVVQCALKLYVHNTTRRCIFHTKKNNNIMRFTCMSPETLRKSWELFSPHILWNDVMKILKSQYSTIHKCIASETTPQNSPD